ncbi:hypothetical protein OMK64_12600 [Cellulomonas fimi]|uniref:hypothetical protein n=1 Tax=Cellulomonas fimi TaxID=1708 RepID=UPI00234CDDD7|nr:hypothetical protein [Cellulomonas fimi]MDC7122372.1 hypothetical protein [Cellulomonas fimi]
MLTRRGPASALLALVVVAAAACSSPAQVRDEVADAASEFYAAIEAGDGEAACALLAPAVVDAVEDEEGEACADALTSGDLGSELASRASDGEVTVRRAGGQAQARTPDDTVFLAASGDGWVVTAAACDPQPPRPYDCALEA